ncbi:hypothetical protein DPMN_016642 [Dreissena polymorpha]|uniref:G-protein coupled receptors family 1 profile domain-containing protein n=1 Tax=Dreissena polymorpha TaxID=45954 RepID=A0A9D4NEZ8_DREPO|nr:hypothetical protein DPMN_016642 [Dreissena polymorpha]
MELIDSHVLVRNVAVIPNDSQYDLSSLAYPGNLTNVPIWEMAIKITFYIILMMCSLLGNILIIIVVVRSKRMQTTTNYFIVNLAISDLLVTACCSWVRLVDELTEGWVLGNIFCKLNSFAQGRRKTTTGEAWYGIARGGVRGSPKPNPNPNPTPNPNPYPNPFLGVSPLTMPRPL